MSSLPASPSPAPPGLAPPGLARPILSYPIPQMEKTLMLEQRAAEFGMRAEDVQALSFTRPTNACMLVTRYGHIPLIIRYTRG